MSTEHQRNNNFQNPYWWQWYPAERLGIEGITEHQQFNHVQTAHLGAWDNLDLAFAKAGIDAEGARIHFEQSSIDFELLAQEAIDLRQLEFDDFHARLGYAYIPVHTARLEERSPTVEEVQETHYKITQLGNIVLSSLREFPKIDAPHKYQALTYAIALQLLTRYYSEDNDYYLPQLASVREITGGYHAYLRPWSNDNEPMRLRLYGKRKTHPAIFRVPLFYCLYGQWGGDISSETALARTQAELHDELEQGKYSSALDNISQALMRSIHQRFNRPAK